MRLAITGSRHWTDSAAVWAALDAIHDELCITVLIHGGADGVDAFAEAWARRRGINSVSLPPDYTKFPPYYAPLERNTRLVHAAFYVIAFRAPGKSNGTDDATQKARQANKLLLVVKSGDGDRFAVEGPARPDFVAVGADRGPVGTLDRTEMRNSITEIIRARVIGDLDRTGKVPDPRPAIGRDATVRRVPRRGRR